MPYLIVLGWGIWDGDVQRSPEGGEVSHIEEILLQNLFFRHCSASSPHQSEPSLHSLLSPSQSRLRLYTSLSSQHADISCQSTGGGKSLGHGVEES